MGACKIVTIIIAVVMAVTLFVTLMAVSFKTLANDELGIKYNHVSRKMDATRVYEQGRYALNPGESFFKFKRIFVTISSNLLCLSEDGLQANLEITFQYRLIKEKLVEFFRSYGKDYERTITLLAITATRDACGDWNATNFFYQREQVQESMGSRLKDSFAAINVESGFFQLINVSLPSAFQQVLRSAQVAQQDSEQAVNERQQYIIQAYTDVLAAQQNATVFIVKANATGNAILATATADAQGITAQVQAQADTYASIMTLIGLSPEELINYISVQTIQNSVDPVIAVGSPATFSFSSNATSN